jgi:acetyl-CoA C-acetyltransferase
VGFVWTGGLASLRVTGVGMASVASGSGKNLSQLFVEAATEAFENAGVSRIGAMYVGNMISGFLQKQEHLGSLMVGPKGFSWFMGEPF